MPQFVHSSRWEYETLRSAERLLLRIPQNDRMIAASFVHAVSIQSELC
jgi:hypothetical protein